jgi:DNA-binding transcriptional MerR regulator
MSESRRGARITKARTQRRRRKERAMSRISSLNHSSVGSASALLREEGHAAPDSAQSEMTISQMSRLFGVSLRTLRFYEDRGLIKPRRDGNARFYRGADRVRMEMILKGKKLGFTLTEIQDLIGQGSDRNAGPRGSAQRAADRHPDRPPGAAAGRNRERHRTVARDTKPPRPRRRRLSGRDRALREAHKRRPMP